MRLFAPIALACTFLLSALLAPGAASAAISPGPSGYNAAPVVCRTGASPAERYAVFEAAARSFRAQDRMEIRLDLQYRGGDSSAWGTVAASGLGRWHAARRGVVVYRFRQRVENLAMPGAYRSVVRFRWLNTQGRVIRSAVRATTACRQADLRPDLRFLGAVERAPAQSAGNSRYSFIVANGGFQPAGDFDVVLRIDNVPVRAVAVESLAPAGRQTLSVIGPRCRTGQLITVTADPDGRVDEAREQNNVLRSVCP